MHSNAGMNCPDGLNGRQLYIRSSALKIGRRTRPIGVAVTPACTLVLLWVGTPLGGGSTAASIGIFTPINLEVGVRRFRRRSCRYPSTHCRNRLYTHAKLRALLASIYGYDSR